MQLRLLFVLLISFSFIHILQAQDARTYLRLGDDYFSAGRFDDALQAYDRYDSMEPGNPIVTERRGISNYFTNNLSDAKILLQELVREEEGSNEIYFYLGRSYHAESDFTTAIRYYKEFLRRTDKTNVNRPLVKDAIRRAANGLRYSRTPGNAFVENLGPRVNSKGDDFKPILSPNFDDRIYFSSSREGNLGGLRNAEGLADDRAGQYSSDMYSTAIENGAWDEAQPMSYLLNSPRYDVVVDFSEQGDRLYYFKGYTLFSGDILVDTFRTRIEDRSLYSAEFDGPLRPWEGDTEMQIWNDTLVLFASRRAGGFGGLDLYISQFSEGRWQAAENLGPTINSAYDETTPFLARDGRTLYFSSNRADRSIGGHDVFRSRYVDSRESWTEPDNLKQPINSSGDDTHFRLAKDGYRGYFSSSRKEGYGKRDLYTALFREYLTEQGEISNPLVFSQVRTRRLATEQPNTGGEPGTPGTTPGFQPSEVETYDLTPLAYEANGKVVTPQNRPILERLVQLNDKFPDAEIILTAHGDGTDPTNFDLYFSIKKAESVAEYLIKNGVPKSAITVRGAGSAYPVAQRYVNGRENAPGQRLNRRVDIQIGNADNAAIEVNYSRPEVSDFMRSFDGNFFVSMNESLVYRVQIAAIGQMYKGDAIQTYPNALVERSFEDQTYRYLIGAEESYEAARRLRDRLIGEGLEGPFVVPYITGERLTSTPTQRDLEEYPDLQKFLGLDGE